MKNGRFFSVPQRNVFGFFRLYRIQKTHQTMIKKISFYKPIFYGIFLIPFFVFSCTSTRVPSGASVDIPEDFFGMCHAGSPQSPREYELMDEMGISWTLRTFAWGSIEREKGVFNFSSFDPWVDSTKRHGKKIIVTLGYEAPWLFPDGKTKRYISSENIPHFLRYVEEIVKHYQGRVDVWKVWNEPNHPRFWKGSNKEFYELSKQTAKKIREVDPDAYIIGVTVTRVPKRFTKKMHKAGGMENLDGIEFHPYAMHPEGVMRLHDKFLRTRSDINFTGPVWITEIGFPTGGRFPTKVSLEGLPSHVVKVMTGAAARSGNTRAMLWYQLFDRYNKNEVPQKTMKDSEAFFGLVYRNFERKNGAHAYQLCANLLPGSRYVPELLQRENIPSSIVSFCFQGGKSGNHTLVLWNDRKRSKKANLYLESPAFLYDITTGEKSPLPAVSSLDIGKQPLIITWQGTERPRLSIK